MLLDEFRDILEGAGAQVETAGSVREGLKLVNDRYAVALLDVRLPDGEAYPIAQRFMGTQTKVIFLSGFGDHSSVLDRYLDAVALTKPVTKGDLIAVISKHSVPT